MNIKLDRVIAVVFTALFVAWLLPISIAGGQTTSRQPASASPTPASQAAAPPAKKPHDSVYLIGDDDQLGINVWGEPDLTQSVPVRSDGKISLPLIGEVQAAGQTPLQLEQDIASKLRAYITKPDVTVMVLKVNSEKFNILGRVQKPGSYSLTSATTVLDAIAEAGGFQDFAKQKDIYILRENPGGGESRISFNYRDVIKGKHPEQNIRIEPHDTIVVP
ncbi:MAG TPA: polysaccharide biosynthesis/export family protein [Acidobacteriaceae bacterium]|nr:polysaccharide biosynthesis/export family protein [Acidobacteriaceae bacterium]